VFEETPEEIVRRELKDVPVLEELADPDLARPVSHGLTAVASLLVLLAVLALRRLPGGK